METAGKIIDLAFGFEGWVFGGYVRDNVVLKMNEVTDIDIVFPEWADIELFIKTLGIFFGVHVYHDQMHEDGLYMSKCSKRLIKMEVDDVDVDLIVTNGGFQEWCNERSTDLSCNLFYMTDTIPLGVRYIPYQFRHRANIANYLIGLAKNKRFCQIYDEKSDNYEEKNMMKVEKRVEKMEDRGWVIVCTCC
jgi:hypothetical protein